MINPVIEKQLSHVLEQWPIPSTEKILEEYFGFKQDDINLILEFMYRTLLSMYVPQEKTNLEKFANLATKLVENNIDPRIFGCEISYENMGEDSSGTRAMTNILYKFSPAVEVDYSKDKIGGFAQVRANLISGYYPEE